MATAVLMIGGMRWWRSLCCCKKWSDGSRPQRVCVRSAFRSVPENWGSDVSGIRGLQVAGCRLRRPGRRVDGAGVRTDQARLRREGGGASAGPSAGEPEILRVCVSRFLWLLRLCDASERTLDSFFFFFLGTGSKKMKEKKRREKRDLGRQNWSSGLPLRGLLRDRRKKSCALVLMHVLILDAGRRFSTLFQAVELVGELPSCWLRGWPGRFKFPNHTKPDPGRQASANSQGVRRQAGVTVCERRSTVAPGRLSPGALSPFRQFQWRGGT